jgi:hypothetical protein
LQKTRESWFLFGEEIGEYLDAIYKKWVDLRYQNTMLHDAGSLPVGSERTRIAQEHSESLKWFNAQIEIARQKFSRHMTLG